MALLSAQATAPAGVGYLVLYNVVFVAPLVHFGAASSPPINRQLARWLLHQRMALKLGTRVITIAVGLLTLLFV